MDLLAEEFDHSLVGKSYLSRAMGNVAAQYCLLSKSWNTYNIRTKTKPVCIPVYIGLGRYRTSSSLPSRTFYLLIYGVYLMVEV